MGFNTKKMQTSGGTPRKGVFPRSTFLSLDDTPDSYVSQAGLVCVVKNDEKRIEFKAVGAIGDHLVLVINTDTTPGTLVNKLTAGENITFTTNNPTGNATITIAAPNVVKLQSSTPGTPQNGHINVWGTVVGSTLKAADAVSTNYTTVVYDGTGSGELLFGGRILTGGPCNLSFFPGGGAAGYKLLLCYYSAAAGVYRSALEFDNPTSPVLFATMRLMKSGGTIISGANYNAVGHGAWSTVNAYYDQVATSFKRVGSGYAFGGMFSSGSYAFYCAENGSAGSAITWVDFMQWQTLQGSLWLYGTSPTFTQTNTTTTYADGDKQVFLLASGSKDGGAVTTQAIGKILFCHNGTADDFKSRVEIYLNTGSAAAIALDMRTDKLYVHVLRNFNSIQFVTYNNDSKEVGYASPGYVNPAHSVYYLVWDVDDAVWALKEFA